MADIFATVSAPALTIGVQGSTVPANMMQVGLECVTSEGSVVTDGQAVRQIGTTLGRTVDTEQNVPGLTTSYAAASGGETGTSDVNLASAVIGSRFYIRSVDVVNKHASATTEVVIKSDSTVLWRTKLSPNEGIVKVFSPPLRTASSATPKFACGTAAEVYLNAQMYWSKE